MFANIINSFIKLFRDNMNMTAFFEVINTVGEF